MPNTDHADIPEAELARVRRGMAEQHGTELTPDQLIADVERLLTAVQQRLLRDYDLRLTKQRVYELIRDRKTWQ